MVALNFAVESNVAFQRVQHCSHCENLRTELPFSYARSRTLVYNQFARGNVLSTTSTAGDDHTCGGEIC